MYNKDGSSIQDIGHNRVLNPILKNDETGSRKYLVDPDVRKIDGTQWSDSDTINNSISLKLI